VNRWNEARKEVHREKQHRGERERIGRGDAVKLAGNESLPSRDIGLSRTIDPEMLKLVPFISSQSASCFSPLAPRQAQGNLAAQVRKVGVSVMEGRVK
jgi:hypothetical protein